MPYGSGTAHKATKANKALLGERKKQKFSYASSKDETNRFYEKSNT